VVNPRYQFRVGVIAVVVVFSLLLLLNLSLYFSSRHSIEAFLQVAPELEAFVHAQERVQLNLIVLGSVVFLAGIFMIALLESHKTAGAAYNIASRMREIQSGRYGTRVVLRRGDNLRELEDVFNEMADSLKERTWSEIEKIRTLASRAGSLNDPEARSIAAALEEMANDKAAQVQ
jgi:methyl-accepting chemotaxis protein